MKNNIEFISFGSDPEFFVLDPKGRVYTATPFTEGTKHNPMPINNLPGFFEFTDNIMFEGNIPPTASKEKFIDNLLTLKSHFQEKVEKFGYSISENGVEYLSSRVLALPEANEFGCSRVYNAWDKQEHLTPNLSNVKFRGAGFHIHIGYKILHPGISKGTMAIVMGRLFDLFLSYPAFVIKPEVERLNTYGAFGSIRMREIPSSDPTQATQIIECRTLSSYFIKPDLLLFVWDQLMKLENFINLLSIHQINSIYYYYNYFRIANKNVEHINRFFRNSFYVFIKFNLKDSTKEIAEQILETYQI